MRIEIREAETSTSDKPLWVWRVWCNGHASQGFSSTQKEATTQADMEQYRLGSSSGPSRRKPR